MRGTATFPARKKHGMAVPVSIAGGTSDKKSDLRGKEEPGCTLGKSARDTVGVPPGGLSVRRGLRHAARCSPANNLYRWLGLRAQRRLVAGGARQGVADTLLPTARGSPLRGQRLSGAARRGPPGAQTGADVEGHREARGADQWRSGHADLPGPRRGARMAEVRNSPGRGGVDVLKAPGPASLENVGTSREGAARA